MNKYFVTLGQKHRHVLPDSQGNQITWGKDGVLQINSETIEKARSFLVQMFGLKWSFLYSEDQMTDSWHYYPKGIIKEFSVDGSFTVIAIRGLEKKFDFTWNGSYFLGTYFNLGTAIKAANDEVKSRGGKYGCIVYDVSVPESNQVYQINCNEIYTDKTL